MTSSAATVLSAPSSQPPLGTESMCPPRRTAFSESLGGSGPEVSSLVAFDLDAVYLIELALEPVAGLDPLVGPGDPAGAVRAAGEVGELF
jgi:hypothetical protein